MKWELKILMKIFNKPIADSKNSINFAFSYKPIKSKNYDTKEK